MKTGRVGIVGVLCGLVLFLSVGCSQPSQMQDLSRPQIVGQVGKSALVKAGDPETGVQYVLLLQGTHYEIGYA